MPALERLELGRELLDAVVALREPHRTAIYLRFWEGLEPAAIAERLGVPVKTVKSRLYRAIEELRVRLDARSSEGRERWLPALTAFAFPRGGALVGGGLVVKKVLVAVVVVVLAAIAWKSMRFTPRAVDAPAETAAAPRLEDAREPARIEPAAGEVERASVESHEPAASPTTGSLVVRLLWSDGSPAADVSLDVQCDADPAPRDEFFRRRTDAEGRARFPELFAGKVALFVDRGAYFESEVAAGEERNVDLTLPEGQTVVGKVVGAADEPIVGAEIWIEGTRFMCSRWHLSGRAATDGSFHARGLGPDAWIGARARGYRSSLVFQVGELPTRADGAREVSLALESGGAEIEGRVVDPHGAPVAGASVKVGYRGGGSVDLPNGLRGEHRGAVSAETDSDGRFLIVGNVPPGWEPVFVCARGWPVWSASVDAGEGQRARVDVVLNDPVSVEGRVLDRAGRPVEGARVDISNEHPGVAPFDGFPTPHHKADRDGHFLLNWLAPGAQELRASASQHPELGRANVQVLCPPGVRTSTELVLDPGLTITGRVVDESGKPLVGWIVTAVPEPRDTPRHEQAHTDGEGRFVIANLDSDHVYTLRPCVLGEIASPARADRPNVEAGSKDVEIVVPASIRADAHVRGRFLGRDGRSPADIHLEYRPEGSNESWYITVDPESGAFDQGLRPGRYQVSAIRGGQILLETEFFDLRAEETKDIGTLVPGALGRLELRLSGVPEAELARLEAWLDRDGHGSERLQLEQGVFRSREVLPGTWSLWLYGNWIVHPRPVELHEGETTRIECAAERGFEVPIDFTFADPDAKWTTLTLHVVNEKGESVQREMTWNRRALLHGRVHVFELSLPAGAFVLDVRTDTGLRASERIEVGPETSSKPTTTIVLR